MSLCDKYFQSETHSNTTKIALNMILEIAKTYKIAKTENLFNRIKQKYNFSVFISLYDNYFQSETHLNTTKIALNMLLEIAKTYKIAKTENVFYRNK